AAWSTGGNAVGQPFVIRRVDRFERDPRVAEEFAVAAEAHLHRDLHAGARLIDGRRRPARPQRGDDVFEGVERLLLGLRDGDGRRQGDRERSADEVNVGSHGWSRLSTKRMAIGRPATAPPNPSVKRSGVQRPSAAVMAWRYVSRVSGAMPGVT